MKIIIETIPHRLQRYNTVGDWYTDKTSGTVRIYISKMGNWKYEFLVGIHEVIEAFLCLDAGILEESVDKFDKSYLGEGEPGDEPNAPYHGQHCMATGVERILAFILGIKWMEYEEAIENATKELRSGTQTLGDA